MALNYVKGKISLISEVESGTSANGYEWSRQTIVIEVPGYNGSFSKIALTVSNDRLNDIEDFEAGAEVEVGYAVAAREWKGRWYNSLDLITIKQQEVPAPAPKRGRTTPIVPPGAPLDPQADDMPF